MSKVYTYWSVNGGVGKTTLSSECAYSIAKKNKDKKVVLLDYNLVNPDTDYHLKLDNVIDMKEMYGYLESNTLTEEVLNNFLSKANKMNNLFVLSGLYDITFFDKIVEPHFELIIELLKHMGIDYILIDIDSSVNIDATFVALDQADRIFIVTDGMYHTVRNTNRYLEDVLSRMDIDDNKIDIIVNKFDKELSNKEELKKLLGRQDAFFIETNKIVPISVNKGVPFVDTENKSTKNIIQEMNLLVEHITKL